MKAKDLVKLSPAKCQAWNEGAAPKLYAVLDAFKKDIEATGGRRRRKRQQLELVS